jgi:hypothetical protein
VEMWADVQRVKLLHVLLELQVQQEQQQAQQQDEKVLVWVGCNAAPASETSAAGSPG